MTSKFPRSSCCASARSGGWTFCPNCHGAIVEQGDAAAVDELSWRTRHGTAGFDPDAFRSWANGYASEIAGVQRQFPRTPEMMLASELRIAESRGLGRIVVLPLAGEYSPRHSAGLFVSAATYRSTAALAAALDVAVG
ncbi:hypothetical protein [Cellulomonas sp.]|uniref:hypothetical protein n=1 Tax=Cellulomonas sp. TaxID=40001 RepID=UPI001B26D434|nr:hypothetical protein [Cellulomonas sp.]MBO9556617.1 hypothetical protein [Cellulomonas sp.]